MTTEENKPFPNYTELTIVLPMPGKKGKRGLIFHFFLVTKGCGK
jgi:hypothetical protein